MILIIIVAVIYFRMAKNKGLIPWAWSLIAVVSYFAGQFIAGILLGAFSPQSLTDLPTVYISAFVSGIIALVIVSVSMNHIAKNKKKDQGFSEELLDDTYKNDDILD